jgi:hypothetical protein
MIESTNSPISHHDVLKGWINVAAEETVTNDGAGLQLFANAQRFDTTNTWVVLMFGFRVLPSKYMAAVGYAPISNVKSTTDTIMANTLSSLIRHIEDTRTPFQVMAVNLHDSEWLTQFFTLVNDVPIYVRGYDRRGTTTKESLTAELRTVLKHNADVFNPVPPPKPSVKR